jgi:hypothetical protein
MRARARALIGARAASIESQHLVRHVHGRVRACAYACRAGARHARDRESARDGEGRAQGPSFLLFAPSRGGDVIGGDISILWRSDRNIARWFRLVYDRG